MPETQNQPFIFSRSNGAIEASSPFVDLSSDGEPIGFSLTLQKEPTFIKPGIVIEGLKFDKDNPSLAEIWGQIDRIKDFTEVKRPRKVLELLRSRVQYPYTWAMEELGQTDSQKAAWVERNVIAEGVMGPNLKLSEIVHCGYGICKHFATSYLYLAHEAGLTVALSTNGPDAVIGGGPGPVTNVYRRDNGEQLFKSCEVGKPIWAGHAWTEVGIGDRWMPVDPTTRLVGDNDKELATFLDANYRAVSTYGIDFQFKHPHLLFHRPRPLDFPVGNSIHTGTFTLNCEAEQRPGTLDPAKKAKYAGEIWPRPTSHSGPLKFKLEAFQSWSGLSVSLLDMQEA